MTFPQYRKRFDNKSFYKITSSTTFDEVQLIGKRFIIYNVQATKYFEQLQVQDMLNIDAEMYALSSQDEFETYYKQAEAYLSHRKSNA